MNFKEWLVLEDSPAAQFFYKLSLYPTDAFDGGEAFVNPKDVFALQQRWRVETKQGRKFINIDKDEYIRKEFITVQSATMPDAGSRSWNHRKTERPNLEVKRTGMDYMGYSKNGRPVTTSKSNRELIVNLSGLFGDDGVDLKPLEDKKFDKPFKRVYEYVLPFIDATGPNSNTNMGVRSKYVGPDDTGEKGSTEQTPVHVANFGFNRKRRKQTYIQNQLGRPHVSAQ